MRDVLQIDLDSWSGDGKIDRTTILKAQKFLGEYEIAGGFEEDTPLTQFRLRHKRQEMKEYFPNVDLIRFENVCVNNLGNFYKTRELHDEDVQYASFLQCDQGMRDNAVLYDAARPSLTVDNAFVLLRQGDHMLGTWLVDILPRLWLLEKTDGFEGKTFVIRKNSPKFVHEILDILGIGKDQRVAFHPREETLVAQSGWYLTSLRLGETVHPILGEFPEWWVECCERYRMTKKLSVPEYDNLERVVLARADRNRSIPNHVCVNANEVENLLIAKHGFRRLFLGSLSMWEIPFVFQNVGNLVGEASNRSLFSLLCPQETPVAVLSNKKHLFATQAGVCRARRQPLKVLFGEFVGDGDFYHQTNFWVDITKVTSDLFDR